MNSISQQRLEILINHLREGQLSVDKFHFSVFRHKDNFRCKTLGCAAGELPFLFPNDWRWSENESQPELINGSNSHSTADDLMLYFDLTNAEIKRLFYPYMIPPECRTGDYNYDDKYCILSPKATKEQVANNMKRLLQQKKIERNYEPH